MTPSQSTLPDASKLSRDEVIFLVAHEILHRIMKIEPDCLTLDHDTGEGSIFTTTDEGQFLAGLLDMLDAMKTRKSN